MQISVIIYMMLLILSLINFKDEFPQRDVGVSKQSATDYAVTDLKVPFLRLENRHAALCSTNTTEETEVTVLEKASGLNLI